MQLRERLTPLGGAVVLLGLVLGIGWGVVGLVTGKPFARLLRAAPTFLLATGALLVAPQLMAWWIQFCNAASGALLAPGPGLPALREMEAVDRVSALGVIALVYLCFALWFLAPADQAARPRRRPARRGPAGDRRRRPAVPPGAALLLAGG